MISGNSAVLVRENDELVDVVNRYQGQGVLNLLALDGVQNQVDAAIVELFPPDAGGAATAAARPPSDVAHRHQPPLTRARPRAPATLAGGLRGAALRATPLASAPVTLHTSPLDNRHRALGAKMVPFGGWEMPIQYPTGTFAEHQACRTDAAAFDVSHLGTVRVTGPGALDRLQAALTNDLAKIAPGRTQYTHLLDPDDASVVDDIIVWWVDDDRFDVMPNASNTAGVVDAIGGDDVTAGRAVIAVQGPRARERLASVSAAAAAVPRRAVAEVEVLGTPCVVAGTGYTGEDGVELAVPADAAAAVWDAVVASGVTPAGLGARDTLRLEAGLPLHGHELGPGITPLQAGPRLGGRVGQGRLPGLRTAAGRARARRQPRRLRGLEVDGRRPPRADCPVLIDGDAGRRRDQRKRVADAAARHRTGLPAARRRRGCRGGGRHPGLARARHGWCPRRSTSSG